MPFRRLNTEGHASSVSPTMAERRSTSNFSSISALMRAGSAVGDVATVEATHDDGTLCAMRPLKTSGTAIIALFVRSTCRVRPIRSKSQAKMISLGI